MTCLSESELEALRLGRLDPGHAAAVQTHLAGCPVCAARASQEDSDGQAPTLTGAAHPPASPAPDALTQGQTPTQAGAAGPPSTPAPDALAQTVVGGPARSGSQEASGGPPARVGRYVVLGLLGRGGMGVVYDAWDPELERRIALKVVRADHAVDLSWQHLRARLLREAQAMARLKAPNVVQVYDAGSDADSVYIAMERVEGVTLRQWLQTAQRSQAEILHALLQAGRGLAAAHEAGLVHRDFKPDNVLVGQDGVKVTDFGLARAAETPAGAAVPEAPLPAAASPSRLEDSLTLTGALLGTPRYMSPEQLLREPADARSDQFGFCVVLYEALHRRHPFPGDSMNALVQAVLAGQVGDPPQAPHVPPWLRRVLLRGLATDPKARFPSMPALLAALEDDPARRRRKVAVALAVAAGVGLVLVGGSLVVQARSGRCRGFEARLEGVWDREAQKDVETAFTATGVPWAADAWRATRGALEAWSRQWLQTRRGVCEATWHSGDQSPELMDLRMACLDRRLDEARALLEVFRAADAQVVKRAVTASDQLPDVGPCRAVTQLEEALERPADPALRPRIEALHRELATARALQVTARYALAAPRAEAVAKEAAALGFLPLHAKALYLVGQIQEKRGTRALAEKTLHEAAIRAEEAGDAQTAASAWALVGYLVGGWGERHDEGLRWLRYARAAFNRAGAGPGVTYAVDRYEARILDLRGDTREAIARYQAILDRLGRVLGPDHVRMGGLTADLGVAQREAGDYEASLRTLERAEAIYEASWGPHHPSLGYVLNNLAITFVRLGRREDARATYLRALEIYEAALGKDHLSALLVRVNLGELARKSGDHQEALTRYDQILGPVEAKLGPTHSYVATVEIGAASSLVALGRHEEAIARARRGLTILEAGKADPMSEAEARFALAQALWASGGKRAQAVSEARRARALLSTGAEQDPGQLAAVTRWLEGHGGR